MSGATDLFGFPLYPGHGRRGRPRHVPTPELRARVRNMRADGINQSAIAAAVGISIPTLHMHYFDELESSSQVWRRRAETDGALSMAGRIDESMRADEVAMFDQVGAKAGNSGAGRGARIAAALLQLLPEDRRLVLSAIDETTRPMTARELEKALMQTKLGCSHRKAVVAALKRFDIVMVCPK